MKKQLCVLFVSILIVISALCGCSEENHGLSMENPTTVTVWHYYNGHAAVVFDALVTEFNNTVGLENGIVVTAQSMGTVADLEAALQNAAVGKVGFSKMPNLFQCYPDTAVALGDTVALVDFNDYVTEDEKLTYVRRYLDAGCIGADNTWNIFPVAAATEVLLLNKTDWNRFAQATGAELDALQTWEGLAETAERYYEWSEGKSFFGRDAFANYLIIGSSQLGHELFQVSGDTVVALDFDKNTMKKLWDNFYVPYIKGYYSQVGNFRCDDARIGEIIALVCSSSGAAYFPSKVANADGVTYPVDCIALPLPNFADTPPYAVLQGAGMSVTKSTEAEEYASVLFLKWFTQSEQNLRFCANSGYLPVSLDAAETSVVSDYLTENVSDSVVSDTITTSLSQSEKYIMYTPAGFAEGTQARAVLARTMLDAAIRDRAAIEEGALIDEYLSDERFNEWYRETLSELKNTVNK
ncbi:MAG: extracellular solute-binding protein [Lachnospiraceae bacterium]|nr:extracellular solute-binding protein [Lachnospiraceae bacterium]